MFSYRKKVIYSNLNICFPEKDKKEIQKIARDFHKNFTDILVESIKCFTISEKELIKRHKVVNAHVLDKYYDEGKSVISVAAHYANWEWGISIGLQTKHKPITLYKPLKNKYTNNYVKLNRERFGMKLVSIKQTGNAFRKISKPASVLLIADQSPHSYGNAFWMNFLGQDTPFIHGPEMYAKKLGMPVVFYNFQRVNRGFYTLEIIDLTDKPNELENGELSKRYMNMLESIIRKNPGDWLWSHKRWKYKRENGKIVPNTIYQ